MGMNDEQKRLIDLGWDIARRLGETDQQAIRQLHRTVKIMGEAVAQELLQQTFEIQSKGGMRTSDGERPRTPGGIFFKLLKDRVGSREYERIFGHRSPQRSGGAKLAPVIPAWTIADLPDVLQELAQQYGEALTVKITVIGRPSNVVQHGDIIVLGMVSEKAPSLPKGLPVPPAQTKYVVLVAKKQWSKVAEAITDASDTLIIEGYPSYTPQHAGITVFTTNITTKQQQAAKREAQKQGGE